MHQMGKASRLGSAAILAILVTFSGCLGQARRGPATDAPDGDDLPPLALPNATLPLFQFEGCKNYLMVLHLPYPTARAVVPDAFDVLGLVPGTVAANAEAYDCERVAGPNATYGPVRLFWAFVVVLVRNESWSDIRDSDRYLLDVIVDSPELQRDLKAQGLPAFVGTFNRQETPPVNGLWADVWTVQTDGASITFDAVRDDFADQTGFKFRGHLWFGAEPYYRTTYLIDETFTALSAGHLSAVGPSLLAQAMGAPATAGDGSLYEPSVFTLQFDGSWT